MRVAELRVTDATGLQPSRGAPLRVEVVNRVGWSDRTTSDYGELFNALGESIAAGPDPDSDDTAADPMTAMLAGLTRMIGPAMLSMTTGAMVGRLAQHALGGYVLPVPRPPGKPMLIALPNLEDFGRQWSLDTDDLRLWVCLHEAVYHAVFGVDHVRDTINDLLLRHASSFETNPRRLEEMLDDFDPSAGGPEALAELQQTLGSPDALLGAVRSEAQEALLPQMTALIAAISGYVDHTMDRIGAQLIGSYDRLAEALRRHRVEASESDRFVERLLGLELDQDQYERGAAFAAGGGGAGRARGAAAAVHRSGQPAHPGRGRRGRALAGADRPARLRISRKASWRPWVVASALGVAAAARVAANRDAAAADDERDHRERGQHRHEP